MKFFTTISLFMLCVFLSSCGLYQGVNTDAGNEGTIFPTDALESKGDIVSSSPSTSEITETVVWKSPFFVDVNRDEKSGYPYVNSEHCQRYICRDQNWLYVAQNDFDKGSTLYRYCGKRKEVIYKSKHGQIYFLNAQSGRVVFQLVEKLGENRQIDKYSIMRLNSDGSNVKKISARVYDLWLYNNRIYFSCFTKWGRKNIESMDINGGDKNTIIKKDKGVHFYVMNEKIYTIYDKDDNNNCELYQMNLDGTGQKIITKFVAVANTICLQEDYIYFIKPETGFLYQFKFGEMQEINLTGEEVEKYFINDESIYYQLRNDENGVKKLSLSDGRKKLITNKGIANLRYFDMILDKKIFFNCDNGKLTYIECVTGEEKVIKLNG